MLFSEVPELRRTGPMTDSSDFTGETTGGPKHNQVSNHIVLYVCACMQKRVQRVAVAPGSLDLATQAQPSHSSPQVSLYGKSIKVCPHFCLS